jgi:hypothetical protein
MPYTRVWSIATPLGTAQAKDIDLIFRQLKEDLEERLEGVLVVDMTADPLVLKDDIIGKYTGKELLIPGVTFREGTINTGGHTTSTGSGASVISLLPIAPGNTIKKIEFLVELMGGASITAQLMSQSFTAAVSLAAMLEELVSITGGKHIMTLNMSQTLAAGSMYFLRVFGTGATVRVYGARITYDSPSNEATV